MMKDNRFDMLIKFAAVCMCINILVLSAAVPLSNEKSLDKEMPLAAAKESTEDYDETSSNEKTSDSPVTPPQVFPESKNKTSKNETALEILQSNTSSDVNKTEEKAANNNENKDSLQDDSNKKSNNENKEPDYDDHEVSVEKKNEDEEEKEKESTNNQDKKENEKDYDEQQQQSTVNDEEVENIQDENQDQGNLEEKFGLNTTSINVFEEPTLKGGHIALIFATTLIFLSATAYVGLILWRKNLEHRYGMRQRLVTEDDYYNNNDVRFFGL